MRYQPTASKLEPILRAPAMGSVVFNGAREGAAVARRLAPAQTGLLRSSIAAVPGPLVRVRTAFGSTMRSSARIQAHVDYSLSVEFGAFRRGTHTQRAQRFLREAAGAINAPRRRVL